MTLEPLVQGLDAPAADYLEQRNIEIERKLVGPDNVVNRREQNKKEIHLNDVIDKIKANPKAARYCPKS
jgi:hypothetical protein